VSVSRSSSGPGAPLSSRSISRCGRLRRRSGVCHALASRLLCRERDRRFADLAGEHFGDVGGVRIRLRHVGAGGAPQIRARQGRSSTGERREPLHRHRVRLGRQHVSPAIGEERAWAASWAGTRSSPDRAPSACSLVASTRVDARRCGDRELALRRTEPAVDLNVRA
jgi:hypothetical protein